jgi:hypothetical protein
MSRILWRRDTTKQWERVNPVLADGEVGLERDTNLLKMGNGSARWLDLPYLVVSTGPQGLDGPQGPVGPMGADVPEETVNTAITIHVNDNAPHPVYDEGPSLALLYNNAKA